MKKTLTILVLILCLIVSAASAAPARQRSEPFGLSDAELMAVQPLVNAVAYAAIQTDTMRYARGTAPAQALVGAVLTRALQERMFPVEIAGSTLALTDAQVKDMTARLFASEDIPLITPAEGGLSLDLTAQTDFIGVHVYAAGEDQTGELTLSGDLYRLSGIEGMAEDAPEDSIRWLGNISLVLKKAQDTPAGHTLVSFDIPERYQATGFHQIIDEDNGFELSYPDIFPVHEEPLAPGEALTLVSADGASRLTVSFVPGTLEELQAAWQAETGHLEHTKVWVTQHGQLTLQGPGEKRLALPDEQAGQCVVLTYTHPEAGPHEHGLYWEFLENSFVVYAHAAG